MSGAANRLRGWLGRLLPWPLKRALFAARGWVNDRLRRRPSGPGQEYWDRLYERNPDPWHVQGGDEYRRMLEPLGERRFDRALELGCSIGVLTEMLAHRCQELVAIDISQRAVAITRERVGVHRGVRVERRTLPDDLPEGTFDLILAPQVLYYLNRDELLRSLRAFEDMLRADGVLLAVHWRPRRGLPMSGDEVHDLLTEHTRLAHAFGGTVDGSRIDRFDKPRDHPGRETAGGTEPSR